MKNTAKFFTALTCMTLASGLVFPALGGAVHADEAPYDFTTGATSFQIGGPSTTEGPVTSYVIGEDTGAITVSDGVEIGGATVKAAATVYDPSNRVVTLDEGKFTPSMIGDYRIEYKVGEIVVCTKVIKVTKSGYYFEFPTNTNRIIPTEMNLNVSDAIKAQGFDGTILLPEPKVFSSKTKEEVENATVAISVQKPSGSSAVVVDTEGNKTFKPDIVGEYIFTYTYSLADSTVVAQKQFSLNVNTTYKNDYTLNHSFDGSKPTTAVLGASTTLPGVKGTNKETGEEVGVYYTISISKGGVDKSSMLDGNKFTPTEKGDYVVKYTIKNAFGTQAESFSFTIKDVKDTQDPEVYFGNLKDGEVEDLSHTVPTKAGLKNIVLPAITAKDNSGETITYKREIYRVRTITLDEGTVGSADSKKPIILNYDAASFADSANIANYKIFNYYDNLNNTDEMEKAFSAGTYRVSYTAIDSSKRDTTKSYSMEVVDAYSVSTPEIEFGTVLPSEIKLGEEVKFDKPTATDSNDDRMIVKTFYRFNGAGDWTQITEENSGKYTIKASTAGLLNIRVEVKNDDGVLAEIFREVKVVDVTDADLPTIESVDSVGDVNTVNNQFDEIELPEITFGDEQVAYMSVVVNVHDKDGNVVSVYGKKLTRNDTDKTLKVSGAKFKASKSGAYSVSYVATDIAGNSVVYSFKTNEVRATVAPSIVNPIFDESVQTLELGESLILPIPSVKNGDGEVIKNPEYTVDVVSAEGEYDAIMLGKFTPRATGKYVLQYTIKDNSLETKSALYTVNVQNTLAPSIDNEFDEFVTLTKGSSYNIPRVLTSTKGVNDIDWSESKIEVIYKGSTYKTLELDAKYSDDAAENAAYNYTFSRDGVYTIKYTVCDTVGNSSTKQFEIKVGDTVKPILEIDSSVDFSDRGVGTKLVIDPSKITVSDGVDKDINIFDNLKVEVRNTSTNETIANKYKNETSVEGYEYEINEVGTYQVTFTLTDEAGNVTSLVKEFAVTEEGAEKEFPTEAIGIILLVLAILVLGGVVAYFVITRRKVKTPEQLKKMQEKKDSKKRNIKK